MGEQPLALDTRALPIIRMTVTETLWERPNGRAGQLRRGSS